MRLSDRLWEIDMEETFFRILHRMRIPVRRKEERLEEAVH